MRNIIFTILLCLMYHAGFSQKQLPAINDGTCLNYLFDLHGQKRTINITIQMNGDSLLMNWVLRSQKGAYYILPEALINGTELSFKQGVNSQTIILKPSETFCMISRSAFRELKANHRFIYNNTTYILNDKDKEITVQLNGVNLDVLHVTAQIDDTEMWILNNPDFPIITNILKNPLGINFSIISVTN